ncbi:YadA-like family protein [Vreelandella alkaliphila]|uniref:YadA-like family protein n=1 Tax=Vreelandella alkaliphila TaxID=272774 RepID=UPI0039F45AEE
MAVGAGALTGGNKSIAIGSGAKASTDMFDGGVEAVAIGNNASAQGTKNVALGSGSVADGSTLSTAAYQPLDVNGNPATVAAPTAGSEVSVGSAGNERRITNVAAGAEDTDAVNVSQLKAVNDVASAGWNVQTNGDAATNVAPNATVQFIDGKNIDITRTGTDITVATADNVDFTNVNVSNQLDVAGDTNIGGNTTIAGNTTIDGDTTVKGDTFLGDNFKVVNNEAYYSGPITDGDHITNKTYVDGEVDGLANTPITFAGDTGTTDRKLGDELNIVTSNANLSTEVTDDETLVIALSDDLDVNSVATNTLNVANNATIGGALNVTGQTTLNGGLDMAGNKITNVAPGTDGTDAVNVDQLTDVSDVANKGWDLTANGEATGENIAPGETADFSEGKNIAITRTGNSIEVATADDVDFTNVNVTNQLDVAGDTNIGGNTTIAGNTTIDGDTTVKGDTFLGDNFKVVNNEAYYSGPITDGDHITNKTYVDGEVDGLANTPITFAGDTGTTDRKLGDELNIVTSNANLSTEVTDDETLVIALSDDLDVNSVATNTLNVANNATIGGALNVTGQTTLNGGLDMAGNKITNVAPGTDGTDAVNVDQLTDVSDVANKGWDLTANGEAIGENIAPGETADFSEGKNIAITRTGNSIEVATADDVDFTNVNVTNQLDVAGDTNIGGNTTIAGNTTIDGDTTVKGDTFLGDNFSVVNNEAYYSGPITDGDHITNKTYVDGEVDGLANTPITFAGDTGTTDRKLGDELNIVTSNANLSTEVTDDETLVIALSDDLDVNNVTVNDSLTVNGPTTLNGGTTIGDSLTLQAGTTVNMGGNQITNVAAGTEGDHAVNLDQLTNVEDIANAGWNLQANGDVDVENIGPGETAIFEEGQNIAITRDGNKINVATADDVDFTNVNVTNQLDVAGDTNIGGNTTIAGDTIVQGDTFLGDNFKVVNNEAFYDGAITEGDHITNKTYVDGLGDDLVAEGLNFAGNDGVEIHKDLGEQLNIVGGMTDLTADAASAENLRTVRNADGELEIQLSKNLTNLESVDSTTVNVTEELTVANNTTINEGGITTNNVDITENLTVAGETKLGDNFVVNNDGNVTYTGDITEGDHITNKTYVDGLGDDLVAEGLNFAGNDGDVIHKDLGEQLNIVGGMTDLTADAASAENLRTVRNADGELEIQLSKNLTNLESVDSTTVNVTEELTVANNTTINEGGITTNNVDITENLTVAGETKLGDNFVVNNDGNVTYTGDITEGDHITNKTYVDGLGDDLVAEGLNFAGNDGDVIHKDLGEQLNIVGGMTDLTADAASAENLRTVRNADGELEIQLSKNLTNLESVDSTTVNVTEELTVANNTTINEGGITTNNVDITENLTVAGETKLGDNFVVNNDGNVTYTGDITEGDHITNKTYVDGLGDDLVAEGLNFAGNDGDVIHKDLGEQLNIVGGMTDLTADAASAENLRTVRNADGELEIQLSKNLTNLESVDSTTVNVTEELTVANNTTINEGGITTNNVDITENLTVAGETKLGDNFVVNNDGNVTYTGDITEGDHITNKTYVDGLGDDLVAEGLNFAGNDGDVIHKDLGEQLNIVGGMTDLTADAASAENLRTVRNADGELEIQLSKNLTNLESVDSTTVNVTEELTVANNTTINEGGITTNNVDITENLTVAGETKLGDNFVVNNDGNVTYTGDITEGDHITNKTYVDGLGDDLVAEGLNFAGNDGDVIHKDLGEQLNIVGGMTDLTADAASAENLRTVRNADGELEIQLSKNLTNLESVDSTTVNVTEELTVANNTTINEGGITTNNVDITENLTVAGETKLGDNFVVNNDGNVTYTGDITEGDHITNKTYVDGLGDDLVAEGLNFAGNDGDVIHKDLGEQLNIVGGMTDLTADAASAENLRTVRNADGELEIQLSKNLTNLESVDSTTVNVTEELTVANNTTINEGGITTNNVDITENLTVEGTTQLGDNFFVTNEGNVTYDGDITEGNHITNKQYVDNSVTELGDTPLTFGANEGEDTARRLGDRLDIVGEEDAEGDSNIITKITDEETLELALNDDLKIDNSITVGDTFIDGDSITTNNMTVNENLTVEGDTHLNENLYVDGSTTINENLTVEGDTHLGDHFSIVNNEAYYDGPITEGDHITNKSYVDNSVTELGDTPLTFGANEGEDTARRLGDRLDIVGEEGAEGDSNIITKITNEETLELALNDDLKIGNSITVGDTFIDGDSVTTNNLTVNENLTVEGETRLGDNFFVTNEGNVTYDGDITEGNHITNKSYVDNSVTELGDTPLIFAGDSGESFERRLGETANVKGGAEGDLTEGNIGVVADGEDTLNVQLAENIDLGEDGSLTINETLIDGNQVTTNNVTVNETLTVEGDTFLNENLTVAGNTTINENLTVEGTTQLGDNFFVTNEGNVTYDGDITEGNHITNKQYVDNSVTELGDTPLTFGANEGEDTERRLGDRLDIVGEADDEGHSNIITKVTDEETLELALNADLNVDNSITVGETFIDGDSITTNNMTVNENLTVEGDTHLGDHFSIVNNEAYYDGPITEGDHITNKSYVDNSVTELGDTPLTFGANEGEDTARRLGDRLDIVGEEGAEGDSNIITKITNEETLELALNDDLKIGNSITVGDTFIDGDSITTNNLTVNENLTVEGETRLGDNFFVTNEGNVTYDGDITEGNHIVNKDYVDGGIGELGDRPIYFAGDTGEKVAKRLRETLTISGELAEDADATGANLRIDSDSKQLNLVMAKNLTDLESITLGGTFISNEGITLGDTIINGTHISSNNLTVTGETKLGDNFFANNDGNVTYTGDITEGTHIVNKDYVDGAGDQLIANNPLTFGANEGEDTERRLGDRLDIVGEADEEGNSNIITKLTDEQTLELALNDDLKVGNSIAVGEGGPTISGDGIDMGDNKITNVTDGDVSADSKDAINGSQLYQLESIVTNVTGDVSNEYVTNNGRGIRYVRTNDSGLAVSDAFAKGQGSTAVGYEAVASADRALAMGYDAIASHQGSVALGEGARTAAAVGTASVEIAGQTYQFAGTSPVATVSVGSVGAERTVTNVAAGRISAESTDAINGSQLHATNQAVGALDNRVTTVEGDISNITNDLADLDDRAVKYDRNDDGSVDYNTITLEGDGGTKITNVAPGDIAQNSSDAVNGSQLWDVQNQITNIEQGGSKYFRANSDGPAADPQGADSIAMGPSSVAAGDRSVASGAGAQANADGSVALGADSVADREGMNGERERFSNESVASTQGAVSVGSEGNERQITNVAGGTRDTDAVNVRQLDAVQRGAVNYDRDEDGNVDYSTITLKGDEGTTITNVAPGVNETDAVNVGQMNELGRRFENEIVNVHGRIDSVERNANAGSASAIAASTVPQAWMPGKSMIGVGAGTYGGESAVSVGISRLSDNGRWVIQGKVTGDSQSNFGAGIGAGWHW